MLATSNDCNSSIQGSSTSSSSDVMTLTTAASSWCAIAIPASTRIRVLRLIRPHTRRMLVAPDNSPSYGFAVRGGKEFGTGFFISNVERNSEAELKGMRIGDQILRVNGFRVDDAVHKEFIQFVTSQDRITLKVRGVGMLPMKDKENDQLSWHVVKMSSISNTPSESSFKSAAIDRDARSKDINVVLNVAPRTKLGLGICKGPEWKPGIFVQFTKEKSVAREAGLRPGDQILSVNSIDFSDVLFSEAVAVMKGSNKLEMIVRTAAGCELFPGESSGYNSSASSVTGDQSPCWADAKSKRLTAVREEPPITPTAACWNESLYAEHQRRNLKIMNAATANGDEMASTSAAAAAALAAGATGKELNKTIIKLSENGTSINNTYIANATSSKRSAPQQDASKLSTKVANTVGSNSSRTSMVPPPPPPPAVNFSVEKLNGVSFSGSHGGNCSQSVTKMVIVDVHRNASTSQKSVSKNQNHSNNNHSNYMLKPATAAAATKPIARKTIGCTVPKAPAFNICRNNSTISSNHHHHNVEGSGSQHNHNSNSGNNNSGSTLSSAITEELKKRKETITQQQQHTPRQHVSSSSTFASTLASKRAQLLPSSSGSGVGRLTSTNNNNNSNNTAAPNCSERSNSDQHTALMDEFKRAHQRMFKNGFHESERKERQEALKRTTMMEDDVNHRASRNFTAAATNEKLTLVNGNDVSGQQNGQQQNGQQINIPPPPPQFANSPPRQNHATNGNSNNHSNNNYKAMQQQKSHSNTSPSTSTTRQQLPITSGHKPPSSPVPDYDNVQIRSTTITTTTTATRSSAYGYASTNLVTNSRESTATASNTASGNRRTMRLGTVTIGEYDQQRKEPAKFDFITTTTTSAAAANNEDAQNPKNLQAELQNTLTRSNNLKKSKGHQQQQQQQQSLSSLEHQSNCPLQNNYDDYEFTKNANNSTTTNVDNLTRKLKGASVTNRTSKIIEVAPPPMRNSNGSSNGNGNGILKNGSSSRNSGSSFSKSSTEKTITFGN